MNSVVDIIPKSNAKHLLKGRIRMRRVPVVNQWKRWGFFDQDLNGLEDVVCVSWVGSCDVEKESREINSQCGHGNWLVFEVLDETWYCGL